MLVTRLFEEALIRWEHEKDFGASFSEQGTKALQWAAVWQWKKRYGHPIVSYAGRYGCDGHHHCRTVAEFLPVRLQLGVRGMRRITVRGGPRRDARFDDDRRSSGDGSGAGVGDAAGGAGRREFSFFGDGTLGSGDLHETMHIAGIWSLPLILVCENNGWEMATPWQKVRKHRELIPYAEPSASPRAKSMAMIPGTFTIRRAGRAHRFKRPASFSRLHHVSQRHLQFPFRFRPASRKILPNGESAIH